MKHKHSIKLTKIGIILLALAAIVIDIASCFILPDCYQLGQLKKDGLINNIIVIVLGNIGAWYCLIQLYRLLLNIEQGNVFFETNAELLNRISLSLLAISIVFLMGTIKFIPSLVLAGIAAFIAMIVRVIRDVFIEAIKMKDELDLTI